MSTTAHFYLSWTIPNLAGTTAVKVRYRIAGTSIWTSEFVAASGTTATVVGVSDRIYDFQYQNINGSDNALSPIVQDIGFSDPAPVISPTNTSVGFYFDNLSEDIDNYTCTIAPYTNPGGIISTVVYNPADVVIGSFTGLSPLTQYYLTITPAANQFFKTFYYVFTTAEVATCPAPQATSASLS